VPALFCAGSKQTPPIILASLHLQSISAVACCLCIVHELPVADEQLGQANAKDVQAVHSGDIDEDEEGAVVSLQVHQLPNSEG
jgi:hypothetical protein